MAAHKRITIRNHSAEANMFARRGFFAFLGVIVILLVLFNNLYNLQVIAYEQYQTRADGNRIKLLPVAPNRGLIYDRNGVLLAENKAIYSLEVIPEQVDDIKSAITELSALLDIDQESQDKFFKETRTTRRFKPIELISRLSEEQVALFSVNQHKYSGFFIEARLKRYYPFGELTTHSLGYVARINVKELRKLDEDGYSENYAATRDIGKLGLEKYHEKLLHGQVGHQEVEVNNQGRIIRVLNFTPPEPGQDLTLTLDIELQMIAKRSLIGKRGAVVAINPRDGGVLAMYSNPSYDGNLFVHGISSKNYNALLKSNDHPLINRTVQGYPPASTIKPFMAITGLEDGIITPETTIYDPGWYQIKGVERHYRDWKKYGHGKVDLSRSLEQSCNTYYYDLAYKLGITKISNMMEKFGFGDYTGIDLYEEDDGTLPSIAYKRARFNKPWYTGETLSVGIGQSYWLVTPLQLARATSILVNKGRILEPHLVKSAMLHQDKKTAINTSTTENSEENSENALAASSNSSTENISETANYINSTNNMRYDEKPPIVLKNPKNWDYVLDALHNTVQVFGATANSAFKGSKYDAAGKTGSAQVAGLGEDEKYDAATTQENQRDNAMFIAFAPFDNPEIVVAVAVENVAKGGGGSNAAPIARQIMDQYFGDRFTDDEITVLPMNNNSVHDHPEHPQQNSHAQHQHLTYQQYAASAGVTQ